MPTGLERHRDPLAYLEEALKSDGFEKEIEKEEVVVADDHRQVRPQLTQRQD